jgi:UDP-2,3-diacylglucosamine hydrolase
MPASNCIYCPATAISCSAPDSLAATGARLHGDWLICDLAGTQALLMHGDTLCTDDLPYQQFRRMVRAPQWQAAFLARPLAERHAIADDLRRKSQQATAGKAMEILDANDDAIASVLRHHDRVLADSWPHTPPGPSFA